MGHDWQSVLEDPSGLVYWVGSSVGQEGDRAALQPKMLAFLPTWQPWVQKSTGCWAAVSLRWLFYMDIREVCDG